MTGRRHDPLQINVAAAASEGAELHGQWPLDTLPRLVDATAEASGQSVTWRAHFARRKARVGGDEVWMHLQAQTRLPRECQRCLQPVLMPVEVDCELRFVATEDEAAALDADVDYDVLALPARCNLRTLVEDELLLAQPLVPKHERCPQPLPLEAASLPDREAPANPFAVLAGLKQGTKP